MRASRSKRERSLPSCSSRSRGPDSRVPRTSCIAAAVVGAVMVTTASAPAGPRVIVADQIRRSVLRLPTRPARPGQKPPVLTPRVLVVGNSIALYSADEGFKHLHTVPPLDVLNL